MLFEGDLNSLMMLLSVSRSLQLWNWSVKIVSRLARFHVQQQQFNRCMIFLSLFFSLQLAISILAAIVDLSMTQEHYQHHHPPVSFWTISFNAHYYLWNARLLRTTPAILSVPWETLKKNAKHDFNSINYANKNYTVLASLSRKLWRKKTSAAQWTVFDEIFSGFISSWVCAHVFIRFSQWNSTGPELAWPPAIG